MPAQLTEQTELQVQVELRQQVEPKQRVEPQRQVEPVQERPEKSVRKRPQPRRESIQMQ